MPVSIAPRRADGQVLSARFGDFHIWYVGQWLICQFGLVLFHLPIMFPMFDLDVISNA